MDFSKITDNLFIGDTPRRDEYDSLRDLGVRLVINMRFDMRPAIDPHQPQLDFLWLRTFDNPVLPIPIRSLKRGVQAALETIQNGGKVYAHCARGRHRGVVMGAAILIALGYDPVEAIELIKLQRPIADPDIFYIRKRILRFAQAWAQVPSPVLEPGLLRPVPHEIRDDMLEPDYHATQPVDYRPLRSPDAVEARVREWLAGQK